MAASGPAAIQGAASSIGGVALGRHRLQTEAKRSLRLVRTIGRRLVNWTTRTEGHEVELERVIGRDPETGVDIRETVKGSDGQAIMVPVLPDDGFRENWNLYERSLRNLLAEQRAREQMARASGADELSDAEFEARLRELAEQAIREMPRDELERVLAARKLTIITASVSVDNPLQGTDGSRNTEPDVVLRTASPVGIGVATSPAGNDGGAPTDLFDFSDGGNDDAG